MAGCRIHQGEPAAAGRTCCIIRQGQICNLCAAVAVVECEEDAGCLCSACDLQVHGANKIAQRHTRWPLCSFCHGSRATRCMANTGSKQFTCEACVFSMPAALRPGMDLIEPLDPPPLMCSSRPQGTKRTGDTLQGARATKHQAEPAAHPAHSHRSLHPPDPTASYTASYAANSSQAEAFTFQDQHFSCRSGMTRAFTGANVIAGTSPMMAHTTSTLAGPQSRVGNQLLEVFNAQGGTFTVGPHSMGLPACKDSCESSGPATRARVSKANGKVQPGIGLPAPASAVAQSQQGQTTACETAGGQAGAARTAMAMGGWAMGLGPQLDPMAHLHMLAMGMALPGASLPEVAGHDSHHLHHSNFSWLLQGIPQLPGTIPLPAFLLPAMMPHPLKVPAPAESQAQQVLDAACDMWTGYADPMAAGSVIRTQARQMAQNQTRPPVWHTVSASTQGSSSGERSLLNCTSDADGPLASRSRPRHVPLPHTPVQPVVAETAAACRAPAVQKPPEAFSTLFSAWKDDESGERERTLAREQNGTTDLEWAPSAAAAFMEARASLTPTAKPQHPLQARPARAKPIAGPPPSQGEPGRSGAGNARPVKQEDPARTVRCPAGINLCPDVPEQLLAQVRAEALTSSAVGVKGPSHPAPSFPVASPVVCGVRTVHDPAPVLAVHALIHDLGASIAGTGVAAVAQDSTSSADTPSVAAKAHSTAQLAVAKDVVYESDLEHHPVVLNSVALPSSQLVPGAAAATPYMLPPHLLQQHLALMAWAAGQGQPEHVMAWAHSLAVGCSESAPPCAAPHSVLPPPATGALDPLAVLPAPCLADRVPVQPTQQAVAAHPAAACTPLFAIPIPLSWGAAVLSAAPASSASHSSYPNISPVLKAILPLQPSTQGPAASSKGAAGGEAAPAKKPAPRTTTSSRKVATEPGGAVSGTQQGEPNKGKSFKQKGQSAQLAPAVAAPVAFTFAPGGGLEWPTQTGTVPWGPFMHALPLPGQDPRLQHAMGMWMGPGLNLPHAAAASILQAQAFAGHTTTTTTMFEPMAAHAATIMPHAAVLQHLWSTQQLLHTTQHGAVHKSVRTDSCYTAMHPGQSPLTGQPSSNASTGGLSWAASERQAAHSNGLPIGGSREGDSLYRAHALARYRAKKQRLKYEKTIRYELRQVRATGRPRINGRFAPGSQDGEPAAGAAAHSQQAAQQGTGITGSVVSLFANFPEVKATTQAKADEQLEAASAPIPAGQDTGMSWGCDSLVASPVVSLLSPVELITSHSRGGWVAGESPGLHLSPLCCEVELEDRIDLKCAGTAHHVQVDRPSMVPFPDLVQWPLSASHYVEGLFDSHFKVEALQGSDACFALLPMSSTHLAGLG